VGSRGPLRKVSSIRGDREKRKRSVKAAQIPAGRPERPDWVPDGLHEAWNAVVSDLEAASVPLQRIDSGAIGLYVLTVEESAKAMRTGDGKLAARLGRDALQWASAIGATVASRARLGIKEKPMSKADAELEKWKAL
jgi:phage terminase small subunit